MDKSEEIKKLKSLLDQDAISKEEFNSLKNEILLNKDVMKNSEGNNNVLSQHQVSNRKRDTQQETPNQDKNADIKSRIDNNNQSSIITSVNSTKIVTAGKSIKKSVMYTVYYIALGFMFTSLLFANGIDIISGGSIDGDEMIAPLIFAFFTLLFWVLSLSSLYQAGTLLVESVNDINKKL